MSATIAVMIGRWSGRAATALAPWAVVGLAVAFPLHVGMNPERFGNARLVSPLAPGRPLSLDGAGGFGSLGPLVDRSPVRPGTERPTQGGTTQARRPRLVAAVEPSPDLDYGAVGSIGARFRVRAVSGGAVLVVDGRGARVVRAGEALPSGAVLVRVEADGTLVTRPDDVQLDDMRPDSPAQARAASVAPDRKS